MLVYDLGPSVADLRVVFTCVCVCVLREVGWRAGVPAVLVGPMLVRVGCRPGAWPLPDGWRWLLAVGATASIAPAAAHGTPWMTWWRFAGAPALGGVGGGLARDLGVRDRLRIAVALGEVLPRPGGHAGCGGPPDGAPLATLLSTCKPPGCRAGGLAVDKVRQCAERFRRSPGLAVKFAWRQRVLAVAGFPEADSALGACTGRDDARGWAVAAP